MIERAWHRDIAMSKGLGSAPAPATTGVRGKTRTTAVRALLAVIACGNYFFIAPRTFSYNRSPAASGEPPSDHNSKDLERDDGRWWDELRGRMCPDATPNPEAWPALFELAREELGLDVNASEEEDGEVLRRFFAFSSGGFGYSSPNGMDHMVYLRVWK